VCVCFAGRERRLTTAHDGIFPPVIFVPFFPHGSLLLVLCILCFGFPVLG